MGVGSSLASNTLNRLMERICLRRTKDVLLNLPPKVEQGVSVRLTSEWEVVSQELHQAFIKIFGRFRTSTDKWDLGEFFTQLLIIRQFCNHPMYAADHLGLRIDQHWRNSAKIVHLVDNLKVLSSPPNLRTPKAVIFSYFVSYLEN